jgi:energy-coupling factor transporter ATP-binding protein EcfA2
MTDPATWKLILTGVKTVNSVLDKNKRNELIKQFNLLIRKNRKIVIFGISGAGKSQFIECLKRNLIIAERTGATEKIRFNLDDFPIKFVDTPGQSARSYARKKELTEILKNGVEGIINVVSFGYEENPDFNLEKVFDEQNKVKESFLSLNRKSEVTRLSEWLPLIQPDSIRWIINLVNKSDLWCEKEEEVLANYTSGEYFAAFSAINEYTNVITIPFCSLIKPYYNVSTSGKFGEIQKENLHSYFVNQLLNLLKTEKSK